MGKDYSICVGAVGFGGGVWHSPDEGDTWNRIRDPFPLEVWPKSALTSTVPI